MKRRTRNAPYGFTLNDYPLYYEDLGRFRPDVNIYRGNAGLAPAGRAAHWMARRIITCSWVVRRFMK